MISIKDMSFEELKEQIDNCKDALEECELGTGDYNSLNAELIVAKSEMKIRREKIQKMIIKDITDPDTMNIEEAGYVSYQQFLSDAETSTEGYSEVLFENFDEEELVRQWKESH
jgi:hypothetical protein